MSKLVSSFAERYKQLLNEANITNSFVANQIGMHRATLTNYLNGKRSPKLETVSKIAEYFQVQPLWLMGYDVEKFNILYDISSAVKKEIPDAPLYALGKEEELFNLLAQLTPEQKQRVADMIKVFLDM